jgi:hypothetical protein
MRSMLRICAVLAMVAMGLLAAGLALAGSSASLEQVRNGPADAVTTPIPAWETGNAGASNSHYLESHSIAYRTVMDQLPTDGSVIELVIGYDAKRSGSYALDYLTHYQRLLPHVLFGHREPEVFDPLNGISGVGPAFTVAPIPLTTRNVSIDPDGTDPEPASLQPRTSMAALPDSERVMTLYGGTLLDVTYVTEGDVDPAVSSSESQIRVRFTANGPKAVLAWGGHIGCRWDWGFNADGSPRSAGGIKGSSYHMRLVTWNLGSLGNQDRSMSTDAVYPVPRCGISNLGPFCAGTTNTHSAPAGMESYAWSLFDNTSGATIVGSATGLSVTVRTGMAGGYGLLLTTGASGFTRQCQATVTVNPPAAADAGADQVVCASAPQVRLAGAVSGGAGRWSGGSGIFSPDASALDVLYTLSAAEVAAGNVTLTLSCTPTSGPCPPASDAMTVVVQRIATANAGSDQTVCASSAQVQLAGVVGGSATGGAWSGGSGSFEPGPATLNARYTPSAAEIAAGGVTLLLTTDDPAGPCPAATDEVGIVIAPVATVDAGPDQHLCAGSPQVQLHGAVGGAAGGGTWSGGTGSFSPRATALDAVYVPAPADIAAGHVTLTLTTNDPAGPCPAVSDPMVVVFDAVATANAGPDQTVCASSPQVQLAGGVQGAASGGTWSGGAGTYDAGPTALNARYTPSAAEIAAGGLTLTLTTNDPAGPCPAASDAVGITIVPAATANAGPDQHLCAGSPQVRLQGTAGGSASGGAWSGGAGTFSPAPTVLDALYTPTVAEIAAGHVTLTLTTNDPAGPCPAVGDAMTVVFDPVTTVSAGPDQAACSSSPQVQLQGSVGGTVSGGTWSGGTGFFSPGRSALNPTYAPSSAEIAAGTVTLTLTSAASSGPCPPVSDAVVITFAPAVTVSAGPDQTVCAASPQVQLAGSAGPGVSLCSWSGGGGTFRPFFTALNAIYTPTAAEVAAGRVTLTLTTNDPPGPCPAVSDQVAILFDAPTVAVPDRVVCDGIAPVTMCAEPGNGVAPFTYRWSTGATTRCISVADTGRYVVTVTDANGCAATGSGVFRHRDCVGQLAHTSTTCDTYMAGTGDDFSQVGYVLRDGVITSISPGVFFYFTKVTAPRPDFTVELLQVRSNPAFPYCEVQQGDQVALYDSDCNPVGGGSSNFPGQATVQIKGATVGQVFIISVKYSLKSLVGVPIGTGCHYEFLTEIDGQIVDSDPEGLQIGGVGTTDVGPAVPDLALYRPMPNPFTRETRIAYAVPAGGQRVTVGIYDIAGRCVRTLTDERPSAGVHSVTWDGRDSQGAHMRVGMYFVHLRIGDRVQQIRVAYLR